MSSKHFATGGSCPPMKDGHHRIYSMKFCPFAQRALLIAEAKSVKYDIVNCNLKNKPEFLLERNPGGQVPVLEMRDGKILYESLIVAEYLNEAFPNERNLYSKDPYRKAQDKILIEKFGSVIGNYYKLVFGLHTNPPFTQDTDPVLKEKLEKLFSGLTIFEKELARRGTLFFAGEQPGMIDYMLWPWFERLPMFKLKLPDLFDFEGAKKQIPTLKTWCERMKQDPAVSKFLMTPEEHLKSGYLEGALSYDW